MNYCYVCQAYFNTPHACAGSNVFKAPAFGCNEETQEQKDIKELRREIDELRKEISDLRSDMYYGNDTSGEEE